MRGEEVSAFYEDNVANSVGAGCLVWCEAVDCLLDLCVRDVGEGTYWFWVFFGVCVKRFGVSLV